MNFNLTDDQLAFREAARSFAEKAMAAGYKVYLIAGGVGEEAIMDFSSDLNIDYPVYQADDILLKTIIRSNPGIVIMDGSTIVAKYHYRKLPPFDQLPKN